MNFICTVDIYGNEAYKIGEICNPNNSYVYFLYRAEDITEKVKGKLRHGKIKKGTKVYLGAKTQDDSRVLIMRDGTIREVIYKEDFAFFAIVMHSFLTFDLSLDFFTMEVGNAAKDKLVMYGGK